MLDDLPVEAGGVGVVSGLQAGAGLRVEGGMVHRLGRGERGQAKGRPSIKIIQKSREFSHVTKIGKLHCING